MTTILNNTQLKHLSLRGFVKTDDGTEIKVEYPNGTDFLTGECLKTIEDFKRTSSNSPVLVVMNRMKEITGLSLSECKKAYDSWDQKNNIKIG